MKMKHKTKGSVNMKKALLISGGIIGGFGVIATILYTMKNRKENV